MLRNLAVGHFYNAPFVETCAPHLGRIREVFFAWPGVTSCRPPPVFDGDVTERLVADLAWARANGIELDTLFNCNCYGEKAVSAELADLVSRTLDAMGARGLFPNTVTTVSPFVATVLRQRFPQVKIRWSVNGRVHGTTGFETILELFDSFYASRERHRDRAYLAELAAWARVHGKTLGLQANSGCLRQCPFQTFHDNMHGHGRLRQSEAGKAFGFSVFRCRENYARGRYEDFIRATWIRPEDLPLYEPHVDIVKLATRRIADPAKIVKAYATYDYDGNLLELMDPIHADLFPGLVDNKAFPADFAAGPMACAHADDCRHCGRCADVLARVLKGT